MSTNAATLREPAYCNKNSGSGQNQLPGAGKKIRQELYFFISALAFILGGKIVCA